MIEKIPVREGFMAKREKGVDPSANQPVVVDIVVVCAPEAESGLRSKISDASKLAGNYLLSAGAGVAKVSREVKDRAATQTLKASSLVSEAYQSAVGDKEAVKKKAVDGGKVAIAGAGVAMASGLAVMALKRIVKAKGFELLKPIGKGNIAANLVDASFTIGHQGYKLYRGETTKSEMVHACAEKGSGMLASIGGAGVGAMAAVALALPTGGASLVVGSASILAGIAGPKVYRYGRALADKIIEDKASPVDSLEPPQQDL